MLWLGGIAVLTNPLFVERELEHQWSDSGAEFLILLDHLYPKAEKVVPKTRIRVMIATSIREYLPFALKLLYPIKARKDKLFTAVPYRRRESLFNFSELIDRTPPHAGTSAAAPEGLALLQYTGGTTGKPKGAMLTHRSILANVVQMTSWLPELKTGDVRFLSVLPFFHVFGMTVSMNLGLYSGCTLVITPRFNPEDILKIIERKNITLFPGVPTIYSALLSHPRLGSFDLSSIRFCITGAAPMPLEMIRQFEQITGSVIVEGYDPFNSYGYPGGLNQKLINPIN